MLQGAQRNLRSQIEIPWLVSSDGPSHTMDFRELEGKRNTQTDEKFLMLRREIVEI
jgi:hypothetical protein